MYLQDLLWEPDDWDLHILPSRSAVRFRGILSAILNDVIWPKSGSLNQL